MAVNANVMQLVRLLDEEGFGALAGDLLTEINLGRETELESDDQPAKLPVEGEIVFTGAPRREPIPEPDQLQVAIQILRLSLVEPVRRLIEAEAIATTLMGEMVRRQVTIAGRGRSISPTRIVFVSPDGDRPADFDRKGPEDELTLAGELDGLLTRVTAEAT